MTTLETLTQTFPLTDPKVRFLANVLLCQRFEVLFVVLHRTHGVDMMGHSWRSLQRCCKAVEYLLLYSALKQDLKSHMHQILSTTCQFGSELKLAAMQDERMQNMMEDMRGKFKAVAAMLGVLEEYFPSQKSSAAGSLAF